MAFEPQPENFSLLQENIIINHLESRVTPIKKAVATERKDAYLWFRDRESMGGGTLWPEYLGSAKSERVLVNCLSLPDIFAEYRIGKIDFLKLDCEGAEFDILESLPAEYFNKIGAISLEYHENLELGRTAAELRAILENNGFKTTTNQSLIYALRELPI